MNKGFKVVLKNVDELKPNPWNPNVLEEEKYKALVYGIKNYGMLQPILIMKDGTIIDGEHRWKASKEAGLKEVWCVQVEDDVLSAKMKTLGFNNIRGIADPTKKQALIDELLKEFDRQVIALNTGLPIGEIVSSTLKAVEEEVKEVSKSGNIEGKQQEIFQTLLKEGLDEDLAKRISEISVVSKPQLEKTTLKGQETGKTFPLTFYFDKKEDYEFVYSFFKSQKGLEPDANKLLELVKDYVSRNKNM